MGSRVTLCWLALLLKCSLSAQVGDLLQDLAHSIPQLDDEQQRTAFVIDVWNEALPITLELNKVTTDQLAAIPILSAQQVHNFINYRTRFGPFLDLYELQAVPGWGLSTIKSLEPYITIRQKDLTYDPRTIGEKLRTIEGYLLFRYKRQFELSQGYLASTSAGFQGTPTAIMTRLRVKKAGDFSFGVTLEKDPGELWGLKNWVPDYWSSHLMLENKGALNRFILGDFQLQWDQGLFMGAGLNLGDQVVTGAKNLHRGAYPHTSVTESNFYRGLAAEFQLGTWVILGFYSKSPLDATLRHADNLAQLPAYITSTKTSGLHRTENELQAKHQQVAKIGGFHIGKTLARVRLTISAAYQLLKWPIIPRSTKYNKFFFQGKRNLNTGLGIEYNWQNFNVFGQWAISRSGGTAYSAGILASLAPAWSFALTMRGFQRNFHAIAPKSIGRSSGNSNEQGITWGFEFMPNRRWNFGYSLNVYRFPWLRFQADQPTMGMQSLLRLAYSPDKQQQVTWRWRLSKSQQNSDYGDNATHRITDLYKHQITLKAHWLLPPQLQFKSRIQWSKVLRSDQLNTQGYLASQEFTYCLERLKLTLGAIWFQTDDFLNRQYTFEKDLLFSFSLPAYAGVGSRWYFLLKTNITRRLQWWVRLGRTKYYDRNQIGTGVNLIESAQKTEFKSQLLLKL